MAVNFPDSPTNGQQHTVGNAVYSYNSAKGTWVDVAASSEISNYLQVANSTSFASTTQLEGYLQVANSTSFSTTGKSISMAIVFGG